MSEPRNPERAALLEEATMLMHDATRCAGYTALAFFMAPGPDGRVYVVDQITDDAARQELRTVLQEWLHKRYPD